MVLTASMTEEPAKNPVFLAPIHLSPANLSWRKNGVCCPATQHKKTGAEAPVN